MQRQGLQAQGSAHQNHNHNQLDSPILTSYLTRSKSSCIPAIEYKQYDHRADMNENCKKLSCFLHHSHPWPASTPCRKHHRPPFFHHPPQPPTTTGTKTYMNMDHVQKRIRITSPPTPLVPCTSTVMCFTLATCVWFCSWVQTLSLAHR